ncbi:MAG: hypothetical protein WB586_30580 [Chthoniobacterales bacterium]
MNRLIYLSEVVDQVEWEGITFDISATADATFDEKKSQLVVQLGCFLKSEGMSENEKPPMLSSLPKPEIVKEMMTREEAIDATKEIFASWAKRVRTRMPE